MMMHKTAAIRVVYDGFVSACSFLFIFLINAFHAGANESLIELNLVR